MPKFTPLYTSSATEVTSTGPSSDEAHMSLAVPAGTYIFFSRFEYQGSGFSSSPVGTGVRSIGESFGADNRADWIQGSNIRIATSGDVTSSSGNVSGNVEISVDGLASGESVTTRNRALLAIPADVLTAGRHYSYDNGTGTDIPSSAVTYTVIDTLSVGTLATSGDSWLVLASVYPSATSSGAGLEWRLNKNSGTTLSPVIRVESQFANVANALPQVIGFIFSLDDGDTIDIEARQTSGGNSTRANVSLIAAINLDEFAQSYGENAGWALTSSGGEAITSATSGYAGEASGTTRFLMFSTGLMQPVNGATAGIEFYETEVESGQYSGSVEGYTTGLFTNIGATVWIPAFNFHMETVTDDDTTRQQYLYTAGGFEEYDTDPPNETYEWPSVLPSFAFIEAKGDAVSETSSSAWIQPLSEPVYLPPHLVQEGLSVCLGVPIPETVPDFTGALQLSEPVYSPPHLLNEGLTEFSPLPIEFDLPGVDMDSWYRQLSEPVYVRPPNVQEGLASTEGVTSEGDEAAILNWWQPVSEPTYATDRVSRHGEVQPGGDLLMAPGSFIYSAFLVDGVACPLSETWDGPAALNFDPETDEDD